MFPKSGNWIGFTNLKGRSRDAAYACRAIFAVETPLSSSLSQTRKITFRESCRLGTATMLRTPLSFLHRSSRMFINLLFSSRLVPSAVAICTLMRLVPPVGRYPIPGNAQYDATKAPRTEASKTTFLFLPWRKKRRDHNRPREIFAPIISVRIRGDQTRFRAPFSSFCSLIQRDASMGTTVNASNNERKMATEIMKATGPNKVPISPLIIKMGMNTAAVVKVLISTAIPTSRVPSTQALKTLFFSSYRCR